MRTGSDATHPTRRSILSAGGALGLGALLAACGSNGNSRNNTATRSVNAGRPFTFTDDRGTTVRLDHAPRNIVAFTGTAAALHDYGITIKGVFGPTTLKDGSPDPQAGDLDVTKLTVIGNAWGEFNIEKYAALQPDLLITNTYVKNSLWYVPDDSKKKIEALAPTIAIGMTDSDLSKIIQRYLQLAAALGADLRSRRVTTAKARFEKAAEALRTAAKTHRIKVMACSGSPDLFYVAKPSSSADLTWFQQLGVDFVTPKHTSGAGYFENLSWEKAGTYDADVLLLDSRTTALQPKDLASKPTWADLPAVKANQIIGWNSEPRFSYAGCAPLVEALAKGISTAHKVS